MSSINVLQKDLDAIKVRNKRVEMDKAWETSGTRRIFIALSTYILITIFMSIIGVDKPLIAAVIPASAYLISTLSLSILKTWWVNNKKK